MKIIKNEYSYSIFYEIDDLNDFQDDSKLEDFEKINFKKVCFIDDIYNICIIELDNDECFYKHDNNLNILLLVSNNKFYQINWNGKFQNISETSLDEYDMEMINKIRNNKVKYFTTQF